MNDFGNNSKLISGGTQDYVRSMCFMFNVYDLDRTWKNEAGLVVYDTQIWGPFE